VYADPGARWQLADGYFEAVVLSGLYYGAVDLHAGRLDVGIYGCLEVWKFGRLDVWMFGFKDVWIYGSLDLWIFGSLDLSSIGG
jgi:acyl CoA:acetate/3-ketoacid CoA transferase beta subunit